MKEMLKKKLGKKKYLESDEISQQEMQKQATESIARKEKGKYRLVYKKDTRTIVAELNKEWRK